MRTGKDRVQADGYTVPVSLGEVRVNPGDIIFGAADGLLVPPKERQEEVLAAANNVALISRWGRRKRYARKSCAARGLHVSRIDEARQKFNYFKLQSRA